jgi:hypothetical protein
MEKTKKLPQINERRAESLSHQGALQILLYNTIEEYKDDSGYEFETYEIDSVLLKLIQRNHESYINMKFGNEM